MHLPDAFSSAWISLSAFDSSQKPTTAFQRQHEEDHDKVFPVPNHSAESIAQSRIHPRE